jgi:hypothetical protein
VVQVQQLGSGQALDFRAAVAREKQKGVVRTEDFVGPGVDDEDGLVPRIGEDAEELAKGIPAEQAREGQGTWRRLGQRLDPGGSDLLSSVAEARGKYTLNRAVLRDGSASDSDALAAEFRHDLVIRKRTWLAVDDLLDHVADGKASVEEPLQGNDAAVGKRHSLVGDRA